ncbi:mRNA capping enzyme, alpha subunit [Rhizophagus irregularis]|uniref:mRNA guanylyltransferase n=1 Tax=Rhizophagus irregularis TaxID=588596 RepID=A0A2N1N8M7_9GLOM|nr:mRNA capping enzyme, alpha subunit [Rhizophagus irregularis]
MSNTPPEVPGQVVDSKYLKELRSRVKELVGVSNFPGAQPISFNSAHLQELQNENYFVCEKTDGTRILIYITCDNSGQQVFLIDRKNYYRFVPSLFFPIPDDPTFSQFHHETLIDGELVNDTESDGEITLKLLTFDLLVIDRKNLMNRPLTSRLGYLKENIIKPYKNMLLKRPELVQTQPFIIDLKQMEFSYGLDKVLDSIPNLRHSSDGLIFTSSIAGYKTGTFEKMLKWKPPNENSIDFLLRYDFQDDEDKPRFCLHKWIANNEHAYYDEMHVTDDEWNETWKHDYKNHEGKIVEVVYDPTMNPHAPWRFLRFRHDKIRGNHQSVVEKIRQSIMDGITEEQAPSIREAWKRRDEEANKPKQLKRPKPEDKSENESREERLENGNKSNKSKRLKYDREDNNENDKKSHRINEDTG